MKNLVVLTGSGISAESGIATFRDNGGLWDTYDVNEVASIEGWYKNPELVINFYNKRRKELQNSKPNGAHYNLAKLEDYFNVTIITQNIDNLHERSGSKNVIHLHGELTKAKSSRADKDIIDIGYNDIHMGDKAADGSQLRPYIVWFGEAVPKMEEAIFATEKADIFIVIGTSLAVYPAAGLVNYTSAGTKLYLIDPKEVSGSYAGHCKFIKEKAVKGTEILLKELLPE